LEYSNPPEEALIFTLRTQHTNKAWVRISVGKTGYHRGRATAFGPAVSALEEMIDRKEDSL
jgi:hypothetical protein